MPHIRALFVEDESMKDLLRRNKLAIRQAVAKHTGYSLDEIALIPDMVGADVADLSDNLLPLEFIIDAGTKCTGATKDMNPRIKDELISTVEELASLNFGIWLRTMVDNNFTEHTPA